MIEITDEMVEAARAARYSVNSQPLDSAWPTILTAVAPLIAAAEREACAELATQLAVNAMNGEPVPDWVLGGEIATAIRARGGEA
jgi:hypothetical protein